MKREYKDIELAVGLRYSEEEKRPPYIVATGQRKLVGQMTSIARRYGIPVRKSSYLAQALAEMPVDSEIPKGLFEEVAEVLQGCEAQAPKGPKNSVLD